MNDPAVLFYTSDFLTGVIDMTMEERGQYITLLCYQHQKGHFSQETIRLLVGNVSDKVLTHFKLDKEGLYFNNRMDIEKETRRKFTESRRKNGQKGGRPKKNNEKPNGKPKQNLMGNEDDNDNNIININNNIYTFIEENLGIILYPADYEIIQSWEDNELTRYAIKQACLNRAFSVKYVDKILSSYKSKNIKTITEAELDNKKYEESKNERKEYKTIQQRNKEFLENWEPKV